MNKKFRFSIMVLISMTILFSGCYNYKDINRVIFVTSMLIDLDENNNIVLYTDTIKPYRNTNESSEKGMRIIFKGEGKSLFEAERNLNLSSSYILNYTQNKAIIFSQKAAEAGLENYMDFLNRDQELVVRSYLFVYYGEIDRLMKLASNDEEYLGAFLNEVVNKMQTSPRTINLNLNDYLVTSKLGDGITIMSAVEVKKGVLRDNLELVGGAVINKEKLVDRMQISQGLSYNFLMNKVNRGTLEVTNPDDKKKIVTLEILNGKTKTDIKVEKDKVELIKTVKIRASIGDVQGKMVLSEENIKKLQENAENNIKKYGTMLFEEFKGKDLDIFNIKREIEMKYPNINIDSPLKKAELKIYPEVVIEGSSTILNAK
ncbi:germination protein, Ger(x)C family [Clostridium amylolyticum]|uniref:Germination protein, Ger(X)C family n=1 Tax=Clostridium amylolyticum TaxID=1121298 RepID=A0A1M6JIB9_9CLOT|nr:Ger(x)C family spore germination protein [Clostridium amylolyticum]SHJ46426.1 germination protein, Ger(x)C family [Clostridium amylolyticum]